MNIFSSQDFTKLVGEYDQNWVIEILQTYNISFTTLNIIMDRECIHELCLNECEDHAWDTNNVTVIYHQSNIKHFGDILSKCVILHIEGSKFIDLFIRTKKLKAFL